MCARKGKSLSFLPPSFLPLSLSVTLSKTSDCGVIKAQSVESVRCVHVCVVCMCIIFRYLANTHTHKTYITSQHSLTSNPKWETHSWAYIWRKTWSRRIYTPQCWLQHCLQWPRHGINLNVHQQRNGQRRCGTYIQWTITQPWKIMK